MKKLWPSFLLTLVVIAFVGCAAKDNEQVSSMENSSDTKIGYKNIAPVDAKKRLDSEEGVILLDVRTSEEYNEKHIPGSILIPVDFIEKDAKLKIEDKEAPIFVYCRSGRRSVIAAESLINQGYTNVFNLGGINDWPYETED